MACQYSALYRRGQLLRARKVNMNWYYVMNGQQVGPLTETDFETAIRAGAITPATLVWREGMTDWQPLEVARPSANALGGTCAGCGKWFGAEELVSIGGTAVCAGCKPAFVQRLQEGAPLVAVQHGTATEADVLAREYHIDIGEALTRAWKAFTDNKQLFVLGTLLLGAVSIGIAIVTSLLGLLIPFGGNLLWQIASGPLTGGFLWYLLRIGRAENLTVTEVFAGFRRQFGQLLLNSLVQGLLVVVCFVPMIIGVVVMGLSMAGKMSGSSGGGFTPVMAGSIGLFVLLLLISVAAMVYISTLWSFAELLIIDKKYSFWPAMQLSRKLVQRRWWMTFGFMFVAGLIMGIGALACGVGLLVSIPVGFAMRAFLFEDNFRDLAPRG